jgi:NADP-dependent 3-hydroxy acid dehydrogenase YdfG
VTIFYCLKEITGNKKKWSSFNEEDQKPINDMIDVNIKGNINIISTCLPKMIEKKYGRIISISSVFSELNVPKNSIYCATKAFVDRFISNANKENIKYGITCNSIQLGYWDGGMCHRVEEKYQEMAKEKISDTDVSHDFEHALRVLSNAEKISETDWLR